MKTNILMILTGGTICSFANDAGEFDSDTEKARTLIVEKFRATDSPWAGEEMTGFDTEQPIDTLSENMTMYYWNTLISTMKDYDFSKYDGVIILHGTDTLAYTSSLLSVLLAGLGIPVFLVSSQLSLNEDSANGVDNFRAAVELIAGGIAPNVYVTYRNTEMIDGKAEDMMYLHYGAHLKQCGIHSDNFYSRDMMTIDELYRVPELKAAPEISPRLYDCPQLSHCVLKIDPYVGMNYDWYALDGVKAVLHGVYHSSTVAADPYAGTLHEYENHGIESLKRRCDDCEPQIPLFIEPCNEDAYRYVTTGRALRGGAYPIWGMTSEMAYVKLMLGCSAGLTGDELAGFVNTEVNGENIY